MKLEFYLYFSLSVGTAGQPNCLSAIIQAYFPTLFVKVESNERNGRQVLLHSNAVFIWRLVLLNLLLGIERYRSGKASGMPGEFPSGLVLMKEGTIRLGFVYFGTPQ